MTSDTTTAADQAPADSGLIGDSARMAAAVAGSRITGLLRIVVAASILGSTVLGDLFVAVNVLPLMLYDVFAGSAISSVLVPPMVKLAGGGEQRSVQRFTANALGLIMVVMGLVAALALASRSLIAGALTAGVDQSLAADAVGVGALLVALIVPQLVLYAAIGVFVAVQQANRRFLLPSAAPMIENLGLLATIVFAGWRYGGGIEVDTAPAGLILTLAIGSGLSVTAHALVQYLGARRAIGRIGIGADWRDREIAALAEPTKASFGWSSIIAARQFALVVAAGFAGAGGVQAFEIATLAYFIPVALIGRPIASAALPRLAAGRGGTAGVLTGYRTTMRLAAWLAVPAGLGLILLNEPLADLIGRGQFAGPEANAMLRYGLAGLGIGAAGDALFEISRQATMAYGDGSGIVRSTWIRAGVAVAGIPLVLAFVDGPPVLLGLGLVVSLGDLVALATTHRTLRADRAWSADGLRHWPRIAAASLLAIGPAAMLSAATESPRGPLGAAGLGVSVLLLFVIGTWLTSGRGRMLQELAASLKHKELT